MSYFANLRIQKIVIHEIYKRDENGDIVQPKFNDHLTTLDAAGLQTLQNRIVNALGDSSHSVEMDVFDSSSDSTFQLGATLLDTNDGEYIDVSKKIAAKLAEKQTSRSIPGGVVIIFSGLTGINSNRYWGIIKAEIQEGFVKETSNETLLLKYITDLLLTPQQRLYKLGIFIEVGNSGSGSYERVIDDFVNYIYDHNMTKNESQHAAFYFYRDFLGCQYSPTDKKLTSDFYYETKNYLKAADLDDEIENELNTALFTYIKVAQEQVIHTESFADEYLPELQRQPYIEYMESKGFPSHAIGKDITYIKNKLRQRKVTFSNSVKIIAPADKFNELLTIEPNRSADETVVIIKGHIEKHD